jgi:glutamine---fructose-6-phosphate transaminase (isomerizing)
MCGIVSAISAGRNVVPLLIDGLKQLEYRGYDSAGIAVINGRLHRVRAPGRVADLESRIVNAPGGDLAGGVGIGHTRWATHGEPSERNAHPHVSGGISVVHNGIIENHDLIRRRLIALGYTFSSDTDTEVIAHLIHSRLATAPSLFAAVRQCLGELTGAYAIAVISDADASRSHRRPQRRAAPGRPRRR